MKENERKNGGTVGGSANSQSLSSSSRPLFRVVVGILVKVFKVFLPGQASAASSSVNRFSVAEEPFEEFFFALFPSPKKVRRSPRTRVREARGWVDGGGLEGFLPGQGSAVCDGEGVQGFLPGQVSTASPSVPRSSSAALLLHGRFRNNQRPTTDDRQPATDNQRPATDNRQPTTNHNQQPTNNQPQPTTTNNQPTTNQQPTTNNHNNTRFMQVAQFWGGLFCA